MNNKLFPQNVVLDNAAQLYDIIMKKQWTLYGERTSHLQQNRSVVSFNNHDILLTSFLQKPKPSFCTQKILTFVLFYFS